MVFRGQDAWRDHPVFRNLHHDPFPGLRKAVVIYGAYMCLEYAYKYTMYGPPKRKSVGH